MSICDFCRYAHDGYDSAGMEDWNCDREEDLVSFGFVPTTSYCPFFKGRVPEEE